MKNKNSKKIILHFALSFCALIFAFCVFTKDADAATLYFSPSKGNFTVDNLLTTSVLVNTQEETINNSDATINFPAELLEVVSVSKSGSIFSLWVEEPAFSNSAGTIIFNGGLPTPGFSGTAGKIVNIVFRVKSAGSASLIFSSAAVRANDGYGTDVLQTRAQAQFTLRAVEAPPPPELPPVEAPPTVGTPSAPKISSPTHPNPEEWYSSNDPKFTWELPSGITGTRLLFGRLPTTVPSIFYSEPISERQLEDLADGIWYFHVQLRNSSGWGGISHFRFQIDTKPPEPFSIKFVDGNTTDNPRPTALFDTIDSLSGIDYYKIKIGEGDFFQLFSETVKGNPYTLPPQSPGKRSILVQAYDKAGNYTVATEEFIIEALEPPVIMEWPRELQSGDELTVKGTTKYPNAQVVVWLQRENDDAKSQTTKSDGKGNFVFIGEEKLKDGIYKLWAEVIDARGAKSLPTDKLVIVVRRPAFLQIGSWAVSLLAVVIPLVALIFILLFMTWYGWHKFASFRKKLKNLRKEVREAESVLHKAFDMLKEDVRVQIKMLEKTRTKRQLTEEEEKIIKQLKKDLDDAEKFVRKEIEDIEREIK